MNITASHSSNGHGKTAPASASPRRFPPKTLLLVRQAAARETLLEVFRAAGMDAVCADTPHKALDLCRKQVYSCIAVDGAAPGACEFCVSLRESGGNRHSYILMTGACRCAGTVVKGAAGCPADDVIRGEIPAVCLRARVRKAAASLAGQVRQRLSASPLTVYPGARQALLNGRPLRLTPREFELLKVLCERSGTPVSYRELSRLVWDCKNFVNMGTIYTHIRSLRRKLSPSGLELIKAIPQTGYMLCDTRGAAVPA